MRALSMSLTLAMLLSLLLLTGCAVGTVRDLVAKGGAGPAKGLGKTILVAKVDLPPESAERMEKAERIATLARQAFEDVPDVELLPAETLQSRLPGRDLIGASDAELAAAALDAGADTVVLVQVLGYGGALSVSFPPVYWLVTLDYAYHARVIDARTGALYLDAHRGKRSSSAYAVSGREALAERFKTDFAALMGEAREGSGSKTASGS